MFSQPYIQFLYERGLTRGAVYFLVLCYKIPQNKTPQMKAVVGSINLKQNIYHIFSPELEPGLTLTTALCQKKFNTT